MRASSSRPRPAAFTLIEMIVVTAISLLLVGVGTFTYVNCLKIYKESQGVMDVFETAKTINRDMRDFLGNIVALRGDFVTPHALYFPGQPDTNSTKVGWNYIIRAGRSYMMRNATYVWPYFYPDIQFAGPQDMRNGYLDHVQGGSFRGGTPDTWGSMPGYTASGYECKDWWLPGFYGKRNGANPAVLNDKTAVVASWGWPRPDYRLDADADDIAGHNNVACWFYAEDRHYSSAYTLALDNSNIVLASMKFTVLPLVNNRQETQLSFVKHHLNGFDHSYMGGTGQVRSDASYGNMLRAVSVTPHYMDASGTLRTMDDTALGCTLTGGNQAGGTEVPYCFDIKFRLRNPVSFSMYTFSQRVFNSNVPQ